MNMRVVSKQDGYAEPSSQTYEYPEGRTGETFFTNDPADRGPWKEEGESK